MTIRTTFAVAHHALRTSADMRFVRISAFFLLAVLFHVLLGWKWTLAAGVIAGFFADRRGALIGALVVGADWLLLLVINYVVDARAVGAMTRAFGSILGNMPSFGVVAITLLIGLLLGLIGGAAGSRLRRLLVTRREKVRT